ncbi:protein FAM32A-like [Ptychodera flava]|uniref:protein FAM32A-like n=1 Tax=Ptychodera flava TaxID=63121 RepID=UPI003969EF70
MASTYTSAGGALKLKGVQNPGLKKKKKKKSKETKKILENIATRQEVTGDDEEDGAMPEKSPVDKRTPAQKAFDKVQEKRQIQRVLEKASMTHKQQVESFNAKLDRLTEHYDIPKVSWTK